MAMTADPDTRLSSVDVLDPAERAQMDEWGNRAVLTELGGRTGIDSGGFRRAGDAGPGCGCGHMRGAVVDLS
jgi:hypothetical protein